MPLIYVTGVSGTGKSTILYELRRRGFEAHGVDEHEYAQWRHRKSGEIKEFPYKESTPKIHDWYKQYAWVLHQEKIAELKQRSDQENKTIFLCGSAEEERNVRRYFDQTVALVADEATIRRRIAARTGNLFGKHPDEMAEILHWLDGYEGRYRDLGATIIDATQPLDKVVEIIVKETSDERSKAI